MKLSELSISAIGKTLLFTGDLQYCERWSAVLVLKCDMWSHEFMVENTSVINKLA